jgi:mannose-6-phosphate isomerase-like protein (cupin superfamily)
VADYTHKRIDEMQGGFGGAFKKARAELGVSSFGMAIIDMPPNYPDYPVHDHSGDGQEEVYLALRGNGEIEIDGQRLPLDADHVVRVAAGTNRKVIPGPEGIRLLALGATPGAAYEVPVFSELDAPDPNFS